MKTVYKLQVILLCSYIKYLVGLEFLNILKYTISTFSFVPIYTDEIAFQKV